MAPVLSFIHVVIVHINVHHPSYTNYYRACPDWRPGLHHLPIPQTVYMPGPLHHCQIILFVTGRGCSPRSIHPLGGTATANCAPLFKELPCSSERQPELVLVNAPESECLHRRGKPSHFHWHLTSSNCCRLIYQGLKKKNILEKQLDDQLPQQVLKPVSFESQKIQKAQVTLLLHRG